MTDLEHDVAEALVLPHLVERPEHLLLKRVVFPVKVGPLGLPLALRVVVVVRQHHGHVAARHGRRRLVHQPAGSTRKSVMLLPCQWT
jgi:hypothetical protein